VTRSNGSIYFREGLFNFLLYMTMHYQDVNCHGTTALLCNMRCEHDYSTASQKIGTYLGSYSMMIDDCNFV